MNPTVYEINISHIEDIDLDDWHAVGDMQYQMEGKDQRPTEICAIIHKDTGDIMINSTDISEPIVQLCVQKKQKVTILKSYDGNVMIFARPHLYYMLGNTLNVDERFGKNYTRSSVETLIEKVRAEYESYSSAKDKLN